MRMNPNIVQVAGGLFLLLLVTLFGLDLLSAVAAEPCPSDAGPDCYPWGAEGPEARRWSYQSKANYLIRGFSQLALMIGTGLFLIFRAGSDRGVSLIEKLLLFGAAAAWASLNLV